LPSPQTALPALCRTEAVGLGIYGPVASLGPTAEAGPLSGATAGVATFRRAQVLLEGVGPPLDPPGAWTAPPPPPLLWAAGDATGAAEPDHPLLEAYTTGPVGFDSYVRGRSGALLRLAYLLTGDHHRAKDLVQATLAKVLPRWDRVTAKGDPHAYVRTVMVHTALGWRRRKWQGERPTDDLPDWPANHDAAAVVADRERLRRALVHLPPRQRAAVVLRHYEDLSEAQAAAAMQCSVGTVKAQTARGLDRLRTLLTDD
jgi:RNA polymerase sigma-70 factor (sigma-E family)